jgi:hypothetical protein
MLSPLDQGAGAGPYGRLEVAAVDADDLDALVDVEGGAQDSAAEVYAEAAEAAALAPGDLGDQVRGEGDHRHHGLAFEIAPAAVGEVQAHVAVPEVKLEGVEGHGLTITRAIVHDKH